jgi:hypothetical protein
MGVKSAHPFHSREAIEKIVEYACADSLAELMGTLAVFGELHRDVVYMLSDACCLLYCLLSPSWSTPALIVWLSSGTVAVFGELYMGAVCCLPSDACCLLSAVCYLLPRSWARGPYPMSYTWTHAQILSLTHTDKHAHTHTHLSTKTTHEVTPKYSFIKPHTRNLPCRSGDS